jgi:hypothetical protein
MCRAGHGLHGNIFRTTTWTIVPIWQFSAACSAVTLSSVEDDGLGEELSGAVGALDARASHYQRPAA